jgi:hypothetical protein
MNKTDTKSTVLLKHHLKALKLAAAAACARSFRRSSAGPRTNLLQDTGGG